MRRTAKVATVAAGLALALGGPAVAAKPVVTHVDEQYLDEDFGEFLTANCGFEVTIATDEHSTIREYPDGTVRVTSTLHFVYTSPYTTLYEDDHFMEFVDPAAGTDRLSGIPFQIKRADGTVIFKDRGTLEFDADGDIAFEHGPHPGLHDQTVFGICSDLNPDAS